MFRSELQEKLKGIFGISKVTFDAPSDSFEQDTIFIEVHDSKARTGEGNAYAKVTGAMVVFSQYGKIPYGFFNKKIQQANLELTKNFFFFEIDSDVANSQARMVNLFERRVKFIYFYAAQYDPDQGSLTSLTFPVPPPEEQIIDIGDGSNLDIGDGQILGV